MALADNASLPGVEACQWRHRRLAHEERRPSRRQPSRSCALHQPARRRAVSTTCPTTSPPFCATPRQCHATWRAAASMNRWLRLPARNRRPRARVSSERLEQLEDGQAAAAAGSAVRPGVEASAAAQGRARKPERKAQSAPADPPEATVTFVVREARAPCCLPRSCSPISARSATRPCSIACAASTSDAGAAGRNLFPVQGQRRGSRGHHRLGGRPQTAPRGRGARTTSCAASARPCRAIRAISASMRRASAALPARLAASAIRQHRGVLLASRQWRSSLSRIVGNARSAR